MRRVMPVLIVGLLLPMVVCGQDDAIRILDKHVDLLSKFCGSSCGHTVIDMEGFFKDNSTIEYHHELIRLIIKQTVLSNTLEPLFEGWSLFKKKFRIEEEPFIREYSILLFLAYKNILVHFSVAKVSIADLVKLSSQIASLPIDQVLTALEHCYHQFMIIMHQYGIQPGISFAAWIREYWWVPPVVVISMIYSIATHFLFSKSFEGDSGNVGDINNLFSLQNDDPSRLVAR